VVRRSVVASAAALALAIAVAACGSSATTTDSASNAASIGTNAADPSGIAHARAVVKSLSVPQAPLAVASLPRAPQKGLTIDIDTCALTVCEATTNAAAQAAKDLGWKVKMFTIPPTPQAYVQAWTQMLQQPPQMIADTSIFPHTIIAKQLAEAQRLKIRIVDMGSGGLPLPSGLTASIAGSAPFARDGQLMGDIVAADAGGKATVLVPVDPTFEAEWTPITDGLKSELKATCGCTITTTQVSVSAPSSQIQSTIINFLKSNPNVKYVAAFTPGYLIGLPQALKAAGLSDVKLVSREPQAVDMQYLQAGEEIGNVLSENAAAGWRTIGDLASASEGIKPAFNVAGYHAILTPHNVHSTVVPTVPGVPADYLTAWHVEQ